MELCSYFNIWYSVAFYGNILFAFETPVSAFAIAVKAAVFVFLKVGVVLFLGLLVGFGLCFCGAQLLPKEVIKAGGFKKF